MIPKAARNKLGWSAVSLLLFAYVLPTSVAAQEVPPAELDLDRIVLANGEIHDGRFVGVAEGRYRLRSVGFGTIDVEPIQVREIWLSQPREFHAKTQRRERARTIRLISDDDGALVIEEPRQPFAPADYMLVQPDPIPFAEFHATIQGTLTIARGNTDSISTGIFAQLRRTTDFDEFLIEYEFGYQETELPDDSIFVSERFHRGEIGYRYFIESWWGIYARNSIRHNLIAGIELWNVAELGATVAPAWYEHVTLSFDLGATWSYRDLVEESRERYFGGAASMLATWQANTRMQFRFRAMADLSFDDTENWNGLLRLTSSLRVTEIVAAGVIAELTYANQPAPGFNNTDFRLIATLGITL